MLNQKTNISEQTFTKKSKDNKKVDAEKLKQEIKEVKREIIKEIEQEKQEELIDRKTVEAKQLSQKQQADVKKIKTPLRAAIIYIQSSKNNTHITLTDITGSEILAKVSGGMLTKNKAHRDEQAAAIGMVQVVENVLATHKISRLIVRVRGKGGIKSDRIGQAAQIILKMLSHDKYEIIYLKDVMPIYYGKKLKYGRRGRKV